MRNQLFVLLFLLICSEVCHAQLSDIEKISFKSIVENGQYHSDVTSLLQLKMDEAVTCNGFGDNYVQERFVFAGKIHIMEKDIIPSTPVRITQKIILSFAVVDIIENKLYDTFSIEFFGIGTNETKSMIGAIRKLNPRNDNLQKMLDSAREKITNFYSTNKTKILTNAKTLASIEKYDEAISLLIDVPPVSQECYEESQKLAASIYQEKIDSEGQQLISSALNIWSQKPNSSGAEDVLPIINQINPHSSAYSQLLELRSEIFSKLTADEKIKLEFEIKKYEDSQMFKRTIVEAVRDIGVAFCQNRPQTITKNIFNLW